MSERKEQWNFEKKLNVKKLQILHLGRNQLIVWFLSAVCFNLELKNPAFWGAKKNEVSTIADMWL